MKKKDLFDNIRDYSPQEIATAIRDGIVSMYELKKETRGQFSPAMQAAVKNILRNASSPTTVELESPQLETPSVNIEVPTPIVEQQPTVQTSTASNDVPLIEFGSSIPTEQPVPKQPIANPIETSSPVTPTLQTGYSYTTSYEPHYSNPTITEQHTERFSTINCPNCNCSVPSNADYCHICGWPVKNAANTSNLQHNSYQPQGPQQPIEQPIQFQQPVVPSVTPPAQVPENLNKFSWGGFILGWIWGVCNGVYWSLLQFIPFVNLIVTILLGVKGRKSAWESSSKKWSSPEEFERIQHSWDKAGLILFIISIVLTFIYLIVFLCVFNNLSY